MLLTELETIIRFDEENGVSEVYTASPRVARLLKARGLEPYRTDKSGGKERGWFFTLPKWSVLLKPERIAIRIGGRRNPANGPGCASTQQVEQEKVKGKVTVPVPHPKAGDDRC